MRTQKTVVILQSNYIPWKGYFDLMAIADEFILYDEVQYTRRDWRNRNRIIINGAPHWLTIPVQTKGDYAAPIDQIQVQDADWARNHWRSIELNYRRAPYFKEIAPVLSATYEKAACLEFLTSINELFLRTIAEILSIPANFSRSNIVERKAQDPTGRLVEICTQRKATRYVSGPAARDYIEEEKFTAAGIALNYANYSGYPVYDQATAKFEHGVSIIDVLFRCGREARTHLKSPRDQSSFLDPH